MNKSNNTIIDIGVQVEDNYINNDVEWMAKIIDAAHKFDNVTIKIYEPVAIEELNFKGKRILEILSDICANNNWPQTKFHFETTNLVQDKSVWPSIDNEIENNVFLSGKHISPQERKTFKYTFGILVNRSNWDRLLLSSHLYTKHKEKTFQRYCNALTNPMHMINFDFDRMLWNTSSAGALDKDLLEQVLGFVKHLPIGQHVYEIIKGDESKIVEYAMSDPVTEYYKNFFVDIVCEKMNAGKVLYFTEKTARPIMTMNPFLINASVGHLANLKKVGFKTFRRYWSEDYDFQNGVPRIKSIQNICDELARLPKSELESMYEDMKPTLEHNRSLYKELTIDKLKKTFII